MNTQLGVCLGDFGLFFFSCSEDKLCSTIVSLIAQLLDLQVPEWCKLQ